MPNLSEVKTLIHTDKTRTVIRWEIDHIKPSNRGGNDTTRNLQALNTSVNRSKGDSLVKRSRHNQ